MAAVRCASNADGLSGPVKSYPGGLWLAGQAAVAAGGHGVGALWRRRRRGCLGQSTCGLPGAQQLGSSSLSLMPAPAAVFAGYTMRPLGLDETVRLAGGVTVQASQLATAAGAAAWAGQQGRACTCFGACNHDRSQDWAARRFCPACSADCQPLSACLPASWQTIPSSPDGQQPAFIVRAPALRLNGALRSKVCGRAGHAF